MIVGNFDTVYCFLYALYHYHSIDNMHELLFLYILNYPVIYLLSEREIANKERAQERERAAAHMQRTVYISKIE